MSHGAITILNATATGRGCSLAINAPTTATWTWTPEFKLTGAPDDKLARACLDVAKEVTGRTGQATIHVDAAFPPSRGLKTSSSVAAAMLEAAGLEPIKHAVEAAKRAGVTLTGAFDDQVATVRGGCHLTDNTQMQILKAIPVPYHHVAVWVPHHGIPKTQVPDAAAIRADIEAAEAKLLAGDVAGALTDNGRAFTQFYQSHGLPVSDTAAQVALDHGAQGAGLSGTGPAVAALFDAPTDLPAVAGGDWAWFEVVP